ncbi:MAG: flagellar basal body P-ring formation chaperone FlgA [Candidatus Thiodiazotropha sp.]
MIQRHRFFVFRKLLPILLLLSGPAQADETAIQSHASIVKAVDTYLQQSFSQQGDQLRIEVSPLDHRLRLNRCDEPLKTFDPPGGISLGRTTVGVSCQLPKPWTLYVSANVGLEIPVVVATRDIGRGDPLASTDLKLEVMDTTHLLRGHFTAVEELVGNQLKRTLRRGQVVTPSMLVVEKTVQRGEQITIVSAIGTIEVRSRGKALRDGNPGDLIPVENLSSKKRLQARVVSSGLVAID